MDCIIEQVFSFYFYAIHLPPAEEGEFLLYYVKLKLRTGYYHVTYQWRTLKNNVCAIMAESEYVNWYKNASHTKYNGYTSSYWSEY